MEKDRKFRALAIAAICIAVVGVSVAYAALTASLTITGTATVEAASWEIQWISPVGTVGNASTAKFATGSPAISGNKLTFAVTFTAPGDTATVTAKIKNNGTLPAKLNGGTVLTATGNDDLAGYITATYEVNGDTFANAANKVLAAGQEIDVEINLALVDTDDASVWAAISALENKTVTYIADFSFIQANDNDTVYFN